MTKALVMLTLLCLAGNFVPAATPVTERSMMAVHARPQQAALLPIVRSQLKMLPISKISVNIDVIASRSDVGLMPLLVGALIHDPWCRAQSSMRNTTYMTLVEPMPKVAAKFRIHPTGTTKFTMDVNWVDDMCLVIKPLGNSIGTVAPHAWIVMLNAEIKSIVDTTVLEIIFKIIFNSLPFLITILAIKLLITNKVTSMKVDSPSDVDAPTTSEITTNITRKSDGEIENRWGWRAQEHSDDDDDDDDSSVMSQSSHSSMSSTSTTSSSSSSSSGSSVSTRSSGSSGSSESSGSSCDDPGREWSRSSRTRFLRRSRSRSFDSLRAPLRRSQLRSPPPSPAADNFESSNLEGESSKYDFAERNEECVVRENEQDEVEGQTSRKVEEDESSESSDAAVFLREVVEVDSDDFVSVECQNESGSSEFALWN